MTLYSDYFKKIKFSEIFEKMLKNLKTYCNDDSLHQHDTYMSVSDVDVSEFEKNESKMISNLKKKIRTKKRLRSLTSKNQISKPNRKRK